MKGTKEITLTRRDRGVLTTVNALRDELRVATTPKKTLDVAVRAAHEKRIFEAIGASVEKCNEWAEIYLCAYWKFGDLVADIPANRPKKKALVDQGFSGTEWQRHYARTLREAITETQIPEYVQVATKQLKSASIDGCLKWIDPGGEKRERRRRATRIRAAAKAKRALRNVDVDSTVRHADCLAVAADLTDDSTRLIFTDPPYHDRSLPVYLDLGLIAARVLVDGGSLITYTSHHRMPEVIAMLQAAGLTFFWPIAMVHEAVSTGTGPLARMTEYGIVVHWKPLLWFVKGTFRSRDDMRFVNDLVASVREKDAHPWQQGTTEARYYIEALTAPGDLVFDPFCGGGTTAVAAKQTARRWLTCDIDEDAVWIARKRLHDTVIE